MCLLEKPARPAAGKQGPSRRLSCAGLVAPAWLGPSRCPWIGSQHPAASAAPPAAGCVVSAKELTPQWLTLHWYLDFHHPATEGAILQLQLVPWCPVAAATAPRWSLVWWQHPAGHNRGSCLKSITGWKLFIVFINTYITILCCFLFCCIHQRVKFSM